MAFDKNDFRAKAREAAKARRLKEAAAGSAPVVGPKPAAPQTEVTAGNADNWAKGGKNTSEGPFPKTGTKTLEARARNQEELEVLEAYRKYKAAKGGQMSEAAGQDERAARIARLKEKAVRRARIEKVKARIAEARAKKGAALDESKNASKNPSQPADVRAKALALKEKVAALRKTLREDGIPGMDPAAGGAADPSLGGAAAPVQLPPEVAAQLQTIVSEVNALAQSAGLAPADPTAGDAAAGIPAAIAAPGAAPLPANTRKEAILKAIADRKALKEGKKAAAPKDQIAETRARVAARRESLAKLRAAALNEGDGAESVGKGAEFFDKYLAPSITQFEGPTVGKSAKSGDTAKPLAGPGGSTPPSIKPAKTWPTKPTGGKKTFEAVEGEEPAEGEEKMEENANWADKHVSRVMERKELNFKSMVRQGLLG